MDNSPLLKLPTEIRLDVLEHSINTSAVEDGNWFDQAAFKVCRQMRDEAISAIYETRNLIFELPDFIPQRLERDSPWPSVIRVRDQYGTIATEIAPRFLRPGGSCRTTAPTFSDIRVCPFHLFNAIRIEIPAPSPEDAAQLMMTWNRLRCIASLLENAKSGLPDIQLVFVENADRSWFEAGRLNLSHQDLFILGADTDNVGSISDLTLMLGAVISLRGARSINIQIPSLAESDGLCQSTVQWLRSSAIKSCKWGEDTGANWDDRFYTRFLEHCELRFHELLSTLESPIAPFLRLEQLASLTHFTCHRMFVLSHHNDGFPSYNETHSIMKRMLLWAIVLTPCNACSCVWERMHECPHLTGFSFDCLSRDECQEWHTLRDERDEGIAAPWDCFAREAKEISPPSPSSDFIESGPDLDVSSTTILRGSEESAFGTCDCFDRGDRWMSRYPEGIEPFQKEVSGTRRHRTSKVYEESDMGDFVFDYRDKRASWFHGFA
ncbi:hypothetical protein MMC10_008390 [Thelotrema lepadinum]|nr:hypothetical protein [Thelotrema lepadinum]